MHASIFLHPATRVALLLVATVALCGCPGQREAESPAVTPVTPAPEMVSCTNEALGFQVEYPAGWHTNDEGPLPACTLFHPGPIEVPEAGEVPLSTAVMFTLHPEPLDDLLLPERALDPVEHQEETTVAGRRAVVREIRGTGELILGAGERGYQYFIDAGGGDTLIASTQEVGPIDYNEKKAILDRMMATLRLLDDDLDDDHDHDHDHDHDDEPDQE